MNKYLLQEQNLQNLKERVEQQENILLFLDYDGTLAPFKDNPAEAVPLSGISEIVADLTQKEGYYLSLVSGRPIKELLSFINNPDLNYAGKHGLNIKLSSGEEFDWNKGQGLPLECLEEVKSYYQQQIRPLSGFKLEDKGQVITIHYPANYQIGHHYEQLKEIVKNYDSYELIRGRQNIEVRPAKWNKSDAVQILSKTIASRSQLLDYLCIYVGDDTTDEDVFRTLKKGITVYVKNEDDLQTAADFYLKAPEDVLKLLQILNTLS